MKNKLAGDYKCMLLNLESLDTYANLSGDAIIKKGHQADYTLPINNATQLNSDSQSFTEWQPEYHMCCS